MTSKGGSFFNGHYQEIATRASGFPFQKWTNEVPNDGLIYYNFLLNAERVMVTSPKGLAEVLVHKSYDFVKPRQFIQSLGQILGIGILMAEGEEHKVRSMETIQASLNQAANRYKGRT